MLRTAEAGWGRRLVVVLVGLLVATSLPALAEDGGVGGDSGVAGLGDPATESDDGLVDEFVDAPYGSVDGPGEDPVGENPELRRVGWSSAVGVVRFVDGRPVGDWGDLPVQIRVPDGALGDTGSVRVEVLGDGRSRGLSPFGAAVRVDFESGGERRVPGVPYEIVVDFSDVAFSEHGFGVGRVMLAWMRECSIVEAEAAAAGAVSECQVVVPVEAEIDFGARVLRAVIDEAALAETVGIVVDVAEVVVPDDLLPGLPSSAPRPLGLGSTGRTAPANLAEQLAMTEVRSAPAGLRISMTMTDPRWPASAGWVKVSQRVNGVEIHYV